MAQGWDFPSLYLGLGRSLPLWGADAGLFRFRYRLLGVVRLRLQYAVPFGVSGYQVRVFLGLNFQLGRGTNPPYLPGVALCLMHLSSMFRGEEE